MAVNRFRHDQQNEMVAEEGIASQPDDGFNRRAFLKFAGFTLAGVGCSRAPVEKAIPYLIKPEEILPGKAVYYASTCGGCSAGCGMLVKNRDGRPVKLEGNLLHPVSRGGLCAVGQASVLGLYDSHRLTHPVREGKRAAWADVDRQIAEELSRTRRAGGAVRILTGSLSGSSLHWTIEEFLKGFDNARHVAYDAVSCSAILDAHADTHGMRVLPTYKFEEATVIAAFDADFLGTWISPVGFTVGYRAGRTLEGVQPKCSYHVQFESRLSLTGSQADERFVVAPNDIGTALTHLAQRVARKAGESIAAGGPCPVDETFIDDLAEKMWHARGRSLVVCGSQDVRVQMLCNYVNHILGNYGATVDIARPQLHRQGDDRALESLLQEIEAGQVAALLVAANPVFDLPEGDRLAKAIDRVGLSVSFADRVDETAEVCRYVCPDHHALEAWGDAEAVGGVVSLFQPAIRPIGDTRSMLESLWTWMGAPRSDRDVVQACWHARVFPRQQQEKAFEIFWERSVHDGLAQVVPDPVQTTAFNATALQPVMGKEGVSDGGFVLLAYPKVGMPDGRHAHNPWLQELPDPISKITWDNYACFSPLAAERLKISTGDVVRLETRDGRSIELPAVLQIGQHDEVVAVALGYGRKGTERFADAGPRWLEARSTVGPNGRVGKNVAPLLAMSAGALRYDLTLVRAIKTGGLHDLGCAQEYDSLRMPERLSPPGSEDRPMVQETTLLAFAADPGAGAANVHAQEKDLWSEDHLYKGHHWGMAIDLNACTGCSACAVACQVENNVPVVGKDEVRRNRQMHWIRIDRYYAGTDGRAAFQPMMCQQCDHAPCETVCPVLATVHSREGLNEQIYNRCIGTRYCANNCPYKARRFNWFDYPRQDWLQNMVLNPDVTVRSRGVMEKCTFCVQRIQEARIAAKAEARPIADGEIQTACQQSCPAQAIVFGDMNDPESRVSRLLKAPRTYRVLAELNVRPSVGYLRKVRNRPEDEGRPSRG